LKNLSLEEHEIKNAVRIFSPLVLGKYKKQLHEKTLQQSKKQKLPKKSSNFPFMVILTSKCNNMVKKNLFVAELWQKNTGSLLACICWEFFGVNDDMDKEIEWSLSTGCLIKAVMGTLMYSQLYREISSQKKPGV